MPKKSVNNAPVSPAADVSGADPHTDTFLYSSGLEGFAEREPALSALLRSRKLSNCGVARLELDFGAAPDAPIVDVRLIAGTEMVK